MRHISSLINLIMASWSSAGAAEDEACAKACQPGLRAPHCATGDRLSLQFGIDYVPLSTTKSESELGKVSESFGVCPTVDSLVGISLKKNFQHIVNGGSIFLKVNHFTTPQNFDPLDAGRDPEQNAPAAYIKIAEKDEDLFHVDVVVLNVTMTKGQFVGIVNVPTILEWDGPGFQPSCDTSGSCIDTKMENRKCIGNVTGKQYCSIKTDSLDTTASGANTRVIVLYYGTDSKGRALTSGATSPFTYNGFSRDFNPYKALSDAF